MTLRRYTSQDKPMWDDFVRNSKNGTFLFERLFMEYHSDRFQDHSLLCFDDKAKLVALLPANEIRSVRQFYSHQGLTYGGFVLHKRIHAVEVGLLFTETIRYLREQGFESWIYKTIPSIYQRVPSEEVEYFLWRNGASLEGCNLSCTINLRSTLPITADASRRHRRQLCLQSGMLLLEGGKQLPADEALRRFWPIMEQNMQLRYGASPIHTLDEMLLLQQRFPQNILCYLVNKGSLSPTDDIAGEVLFVSQQVAHAQYGHCSPEGRSLGALDFLYLSLIDHFATEHPDVRYFDFGTSNGDGGRYLNEALIAQKEGLGGRGIAYKIFSIPL